MERTMREQGEQKRRRAAGTVVLSVIGGLLCALLLPLLVLNILLIVRSLTKPDAPPDVGGVLPLIVLSDSMYPTVQAGDLIFCRATAPEEIAVGDVIAFFDPGSETNVIVTHRVAGIEQTAEGLCYTTKGDANNVEDLRAVPAGRLVGRYAWRLPKMGRVAMFIQTIPGILLCVVLPFILLLGGDLVRHRLLEKRSRADSDAMRRELEQLRAEKEQGFARPEDDPKP